MTRAEIPKECPSCSRLPGNFRVTNGNLSGFAAAEKLETIFHIDESGALPEYRVLRCATCATSYIFSSHATISGGDYESVDAYFKLTPADSARLNEFFAWFAGEGRNSNGLPGRIGRLLADFSTNNQVFGFSALLALQKNS